VRADTDAPVYYADEPHADGSLGQATLHNGLTQSIYLPGCSQPALEQELGSGHWQSSGPQIVCVL
jgi:hypothetical protein